MKSSSFLMLMLAITLIFSSVSYGKPKGHTFQKESKITGGINGTHFNITTIAVPEISLQVYNTNAADVVECPAMQKVEQTSDEFAPVKEISPYQQITVETRYNLRC